MVHDLVWRKCSSFSLYPQMKSQRVHCTPKNFDVPPKMKVKGYMYPQMKKTCGHTALGPIGLMNFKNSVQSWLFYDTFKISAIFQLYHGSQFIGTCTGNLEKTTTCRNWHKGRNQNLNFAQVHVYRSLQVYQRSYSQVGHRVLSDFTLKIVGHVRQNPPRSE